MAENRGLHGKKIDLTGYLPVGMAQGTEALVQKLLDAGNQLRYGMSEDERQEMVRTLSAPGVRDAAFAKVAQSITNPKYGEPGEPQFIEGTKEEFDPAAAERYTSAYLFGKRFGPAMEDTGIRALAHKISSGGRKTMHALGVPGVDEERRELEAAEELGMNRGAGAWRTGTGVHKDARGSMIEKLARLFGQ